MALAWRWWSATRALFLLCSPSNIP